MKKDSFKKKLAAYIVMSEAFLLAHPFDAEAQILYTDVNPDLVISQGYFNLDLNNDGVVDFKLKNGQGNPISFTNSTYVSAIENDIINIGSNKIVTDTFSGFPTPINTAAPIDSGNHWGVNPLLHIHTNATWVWQYNSHSQTYSVFMEHFTDHGNFLGIDKFVGIKQNSGGNTYYGWARLDVFNDSMVLKDYAVNMIPDSSIFAGDGSAGCATGNYSLFPNGNQIICEGDSAVVNVLNTSGSNVQWSYYGSWINGETDTSFLVTQPGIYTALVSDSNCAVMTSGVNFNNVFIHAYATYKHETTCESSDGVINVTVYGNSPSYLYQWSNGETTEDLNNIPGGIYQLIVTSTTCPVSDTLNVNLSTSLNPEPVIYVDSLTLTTDYYDFYQWFLNGTEIQGEYYKDYTASKVGYYQVEVGNYYDYYDYCTGLSDSFYLSYIPGLIDTSEFHFTVFDKKLVFSFSELLLLYDIEIFNELGQLVIKRKITGKTVEIDVSDFPRSIYFFRVTTNLKTHSGKFFMK